MTFGRKKYEREEAKKEKIEKKQEKGKIKEKQRSKGAQIKVKNVQMDYIGRTLKKGGQISFSTKGDGVYG